MWQAAGFNARAFEDINQLIWEKFLCNVTFSAPCTVFNCTVGELMANPVWWAIATGCAREAFACGQAQHIKFGFDEVTAYVTSFGAGMPLARPSMLLDHQVLRVSEIDAINGMVPVLGRELGLLTPYNDVMAAMVRRREEAFV